MRVVLLTSRGAPGLEHLLADPNRGSVWDLSLVIGSETSFAEMPLLDEANVPYELRPMRAVSGFRNLRVREDYDQELADVISRVDADYILLDGYQYILTEPMLARFPEKILAIHDADLSLRDRVYLGPHAVRDAVLAGERETRSSIYMITREVARGPLFLLGNRYPLAPVALDARERGDIDLLLAYAALHRRWMLTTSWGPMLSRALELLAGGSITVIGDIVWIDGAPGPCRFGEAPSACHEPETMLARGIPRSCPFIAAE